jgi:hypothetical protein
MNMPDFLTSFRGDRSSLLTKERIYVGVYNKLAARKIGRLEIVEKIHVRKHISFNLPKFLIFVILFTFLPIRLLILTDYRKGKR